MWIAYSSNWHLMDLSKCPFSLSCTLGPQLGLQMHLNIIFQLQLHSVPLLSSSCFFPVNTHTWNPLEMWRPICDSLIPWLCYLWLTLPCNLRNRLIGGDSLVQGPMASNWQKCTFPDIRGVNYLMWIISLLTSFAEVCISLRKA